MNESFQTYESHVPYNLQFLMDFNLFGMNLIHLDWVKFRRLPITIEEDEPGILKEKIHTFLTQVYIKSNLRKRCKFSKIFS